MSVRAQIPWLRVFVEGVVIVGSILLAFGIDAWWDGVQEAKTRQTLLLALASDFDSVAVDIDRVLGNHEAARASAAQLVQMARAGNLTSQDAPRVDSLLTDLWEPATFDPPTGTVEALINSGELGVLDSDVLVAELTAWPALLVDLRQAEELAIKHAVEEYGPFLRRNGVNTNDLNWGVARPPPWTLAHTEGYRLLSDTEFEGIVGDTYFRFGTLVYDAGRIRAKVELIRSLIDRQLDEAG